MNTEVKNYVESKIDRVYKNEEVGFLILNRYKKGQYHWDFLDCEVKVVEFNKDHTSVEKVNGEILKGDGNREKINNYIKAAEQDGEYISHQLLWHTHSLKEMLSFYASHNKIHKNLPDLDKKTYTSFELKKICDTAKDINFEDCHTASERAPKAAYAR